MMKAQKSLHMNEVPEIARESFINLSEEKFSSNYGNTLTYLMELYDFWFPILFGLEGRVQALEGKPIIPEKKVEDQESEKIIKTIGGKIKTW